MEPRSATAVVGEDREHYAAGFTASTLTWVAVPDLGCMLEVRARIRYNGAAASAVIMPAHAADTLDCRSVEPRRSVTPGQSAVFYDGDRVIGGGTIEEAIGG